MLPREKDRPDVARSLIDFRLLSGQAHDLRGTAGLIEGLSCGQLLADRVLDANWLRDMLTGAGIKAVIPPKCNRRLPAGSTATHANGDI